MRLGPVGVWTKRITILVLGLAAVSVLLGVFFDGLFVVSAQPTGDIAIKGPLPGILQANTWINFAQLAAILGVLWRGAAWTARIEEKLTAVMSRMDDHVERIERMENALMEGKKR